jgi:hypothetical protein
MTQIAGRRLFILRLVGVSILAFSIWRIVDGHATGAIEVGTRRSSFFLSGEDMWLGYLFWVIGAAVAIILCFIHLAHTKTHRLLSKLVGVAFFVTLGLCFLKGVHAL